MYTYAYTPFLTNSSAQEVSTNEPRQIIKPLTIFWKAVPVCYLNLNLGTNAYKQTKNNHALVQYDLTTPLSNMT